MKRGVWPNLAFWQNLLVFNMFVLQGNIIVLLVAIHFSLPWWTLIAPGVGAAVGFLNMLFCCEKIRGPRP